MEADCGLAHFPIGTEIIYKQALPAPENGKARKPPVDHPATVEKPYELGVMDSAGRESIMNLKALVDKISKSPKRSKRESHSRSHRE